LLAHVLKNKKVLGYVYFYRHAIATSEEHASSFFGGQK
jgi:hypothetical protein